MGEAGAARHRRKAGMRPAARWQLYSGFLIQMCEGMSITFIFPFLPFFAEHLGYEGHRTSVAAGIIATSFCAGQTLSAIPWGRAADRFGRRPSLLFGMAGTALSLLVFGSAGSLWQAALGRFLGGVLNGNVGVLKIWISEICGAEFQAAGLALLPTAWGLGVVLGPALGGLLAQPASQYPSSPFATAALWRAFPFLLPCVAVAVVICASLGLCALTVRETLPDAPRLLPCGTGPRAGGGAAARGRGGGARRPQGAEGGGMRLRDVLESRVARYAVGSYAIEAFMYIVLDEATPFLLRQDAADGGGGMAQARIGILISVGGAALLSGPFIVPAMERRLGRRACFTRCNAVLCPLFAAFPLLTALAGRGPALLADAATVLLLFAKNILGSTVFTMCFLMINESIDNDPARMGTVNGVAQLGAAFMRAVGPLVAGGLWSVGLYVSFARCALVFVLLAALAAAAAAYGAAAPDKLDDARSKARLAKRYELPELRLGSDEEEASLLTETF